MNEPATSTVPYIPPGHPVRRFVVGIACIAALLGAVWWSGIGRPALSVEVIDVSDEGATIVLTNDGPTSLELRAAEWNDPRLDGKAIELPTKALSGGEAVEVRVRFTAVCAPTPPGGYHLPLRVTARTVLGLDRTVDADSIAVIGDRACDVATDVPTTDVPISVE